MKLLYCAISYAEAQLYFILQSGFEDIWLFVDLSLLYSVSNILSKATLDLRIKVGKYFITCFNKIWCGPRLEVQPLNSPRIRRLNADIEIQNMLFEYTTTILSQVYLACYLVVSYEVSTWAVINYKRFFDPNGNKFGHRFSEQHSYGLHSGSYLRYSLAKSVVEILASSPSSKSSDDYRVCIIFCHSSGACVYQGRLCIEG